MAKQFTYKKTVTESLSVKGIMNDNATAITYTNEDKDDVTVSIQSLLDKFASQGVVLTIKTQSDEELDLDEEE